MNDIISLDNLAVGQTARIVRINTANPALKRRIMDMGIVKGVKIRIVKVAPLGDPVQVKVRNYMLSLRKFDLSLLLYCLLNNHYFPHTL